MKLGVSTGTLVKDTRGVSSGAVEFAGACCCLCPTKYQGQQADARLRSHLTGDHRRHPLLIAADERLGKGGRVTRTYSGPRWKHEL